MKWIKRGHIFKPNGLFNWSDSYAQIPRPLILKDKIRIFYATRYFDNLNLPVSQTSYIDVDKQELSKILYISDKPSLPLGDVGSFSHFGIHPTMLIEHDNKLLFFYQGWNRSVKVPYETWIGLAISNDYGHSFTKQGNRPIIDKSIEDPLFINGVYIYKNTNHFVMWYSSGLKWVEYNNKQEAIYLIKQAISYDLLNWEKNNNTCIPSKFENECQNSATVIKIEEKYHMWFCYRYGLDFRNVNRGYRIGYAFSYDLINWCRDDSAAGIDVSDNDSWDSQMICYPYVFEVDGRFLMLYSGNFFGKDGFGYAELEL